MLILSVSASPIVILPPIVTLPVTSKFPPIVALLLVSTVVKYASFQRRLLVPKSLLLSTGISALSKRAVTVTVSDEALPKSVLPVTIRSSVVIVVGLNDPAVRAPVIVAPPLICKPVPVILPITSRSPLASTLPSKSTLPVPFGLRTRLLFVPSVVIVLPLKRISLSVSPPTSL